MNEWSVGPVGDDAGPFGVLAGESLLVPGKEAWETYIRRVGPENVRLIRSSGRMVGGLAFYRMGQWYGGKCLKSAGVSAVAIDPAYRGTGVCKTLLIETLRELHAEQFPLAVLYASTQNLYRSVGFEQSGDRLGYKLPMESLNSRSGSRDLPMTRYVDPPVEILNQMAQVRAARCNGALERTNGLWERIYQPLGAEGTSTYLIGPEKDPLGYVVVQYGTRAGGVPQALVATDWVANTPAAMQRLITFIRDHRSLCDAFQWFGGAQDPLLYSANEQRCQVVDHLRTLSRIVDVPRALSGRGYPVGLQGILQLSVSDPLLPENVGNWELHLDGSGQASVTQGGDGSLQISVQQLVPLFASYLSCSDLIVAGAAVCDSRDQIALADAAFAGPMPWTTEIF